MIRDEYREGMTLLQYARAWVDMEPHLEHLKGLASECKIVVEMGVRGAVSTWALLDGLPEDGRVVSVDIDPLCPIPPRVREDARFTFIAGNDLEADYPDDVDMVMIDSSHEYDQTVKELDLAASMKPKIIAFHDYLYTVTPGVKQAVDEFVAKGEYGWDVLHVSPWGLGVLRPA